MAKVKAGPQTARLITINHNGKSYDIVPGGTGAVFVDVPNDAVKTPFVKALIESGELVMVESDSPVEDDDGLDELRAEAEKLGVKVDKRWKEERIQQEIDKALKAE